ncbi:TPA: glycosyltransferase, partial [Escherichia coli]|nr:glycosyltransferase [Escherichia coli]
CLSKADFVSTISNTMIDKAISKGVKRENTIFFPNWSELDKFKNILVNDVEEFRKDLNLPSNRKIILYSGNVGDKQGLEIIPDIASNPAFSDSVFLIVGEGAGKKRLEEKVLSSQLTNVLFRPLQPYNKLPLLLSMADCHLVIQKRGAADAVLPSKLTNILAVGGNAIITAEIHTELGQLTTNYPGIAVRVEPESDVSLTEGLIHALSLPKFNSIAESYANKMLDKEVILNEYLEVISSKVN